MDSTEPQFTFGSRSSQLLPPVSAFSSYSLLRNCNYFIGAPSQELHLKSLREVPTSNSRLAASDDIQLFPMIDNEKPSLNLAPKAFFTPLIPYSHSLHLLKTDEAVSRLSALSPTAIESPNFKKHRSEKKPIPEEQKDGKYFERRRRNNLAAKKSRDARKIREDQIALKATLLEHENAILRAQILTLREEAASLRQMVWQRKAFELPPKDAQLCVHTQ